MYTWGSSSLELLPLFRLRQWGGWIISNGYSKLSNNVIIYWYHSLDSTNEKAKYSHRRPIDDDVPIMIFQIILCGGSSCSSLDGNKWKEVAQLTEKRWISFINDIDLCPSIHRHHQSRQCSWHRLLTKPGVTCFLQKETFKWIYFPRESFKYSLLRCETNESCQF